jgi:hypothetical protein
MTLRVGEEDVERVDRELLATEGERHVDLRVAREGHRAVFVTHRTRQIPVDGVEDLPAITRG